MFVVGLLDCWLEMDGRRTLVPGGSTMGVASKEKDPSIVLNTKRAGLWWHGCIMLSIVTMFSESAPVC